MANEIIRAAAKSNGVRLWEIANYLGVSEATITRRLRVELDKPERERFVSVIGEIRKAKAAG